MQMFSRTAAAKGQDAEYKRAAAVAIGCVMLKVRMMQRPLVVIVLPECTFCEILYFPHLFHWRESL